MTLDFQAAPLPTRDALVGLYRDAGWTAYTADPGRLERAVRGSGYVVAAREGETLVGLVRGVSDGVSIAYLQDVLVARSHRRRGIGRALVRAFLDRYRDVRQIVLLCDGSDAQRAFYASLGFTDVSSLLETPLAAFVRIEGAC